MRNAGIKKNRISRLQLLENDSIIRPGYELDFAFKDVQELLPVVLL